MVQGLEHRHHLGIWEEEFTTKSAMGLSQELPP